MVYGIIMKLGLPQDGWLQLREGKGKIHERENSCQPSPEMR